MKSRRDVDLGINVRSVIGSGPFSGRGEARNAKEAVMTLEHLVVYGGIILGSWLLAIVTFLATANRHGSVLDLDAKREAQETRYAPERGSWAGRLRHAFGHR